MLKVSVLVPVYNVEKYIEKCARRLFSNTISSDCEFIFINDCTPDSSMEKLNNTIKDYPKLKKNIVIINHEKNKGISAVRNTAINNANGEYLLYTDSDDWVEPNYIEDLYTEAKKGNYDIVGCDFYYEREYTKHGKKLLKKHLSMQPLNMNSKICLNDLYEDKVGAYLWCKLIKRDFVLNNKLSFTEDIFCLEDMLFITKALNKSPTISYIPEALYHYAIHEVSCIHGGYNIKKAENVFLLFDYLNNYLKENNMDWASNSFGILVCRIKYDLLVFGNCAVQKKCLNTKKEANRFVNQIKIKTFYKLILKLSNISPKFAYFILHSFFLVKCLLKKIDSKKYFEEK